MSTGIILLDDRKEVCEKLGVDDLRDEIREAVDKGLVTYKELSKLVDRNETYVQQYVTKGTPRKMDGDLLRLIQERLASTSENVPQRDPAVRQRGQRPLILLDKNLFGDGTKMPIFSAAQGGDGHLIVTFDPIGSRPTPAVLTDVKGAYGLLIVGTSMVPAYRPGHIALVNPHLPPMRDRDGVFYHIDAYDSGEAIIKHLVGYNDKEWHLEQHNPAERFTEFRVDWPIYHRVVGRYDD